jgi:hypothetical protein
VNLDRPQAQEVSYVLSSMKLSFYESPQGVNDAPKKLATLANAQARLDIDGQR